MTSNCERLEVFLKLERRQNNMAKKIFTKDMIEIVSAMKGETIVSYQCSQIDEWSRTYGNFRINMEDYVIEVTNEEK